MKLRVSLKLKIHEYFLRIRGRLETSSDILRMIWGANKMINLQQSKVYLIKFSGFSRSMGAILISN